MNDTVFISVFLAPMKRGRPSNHTPVFSMQYTNDDGSIEVYKFNKKNFNLVSVVLPENATKINNESIQIDILNKLSQNGIQNEAISQLLFTTNIKQEKITNNNGSLNSKNGIDPKESLNDSFNTKLESCEISDEERILDMKSNYKVEPNDDCIELTQDDIIFVDQSIYQKNDISDHFFSFDISELNSCIAPIPDTDKDCDIDFNNLKNFDFFGVDTA